MTLLLSGELQANAAQPYTDALRHLRRMLKPRLSATSYGPAVSEYAVVGIVQQRDTPLNKEGWQFFRPRRLAEFRLRIDYDAFMKCDQADRHRLIFAALLRSAGIAPTLQITDFDAERFAQDLIELGLEHQLV